MKKIQFISILIVVLLFPISGYAGTQKIKLVGTPKVRVVNAPQVVSAHATFNANTKTVLTVPDGKTFILTDIVSASGAIFDISEDNIRKTRVQTSDWPIHFRTGIPFSSGSDIIVGTDEPDARDITITGYLLKN